MRRILVILSYGVVFLIALAACTAYRLHHEIRSVTGPPPQVLPLLVITGPESAPVARVIFYQDLRELQQLEGPVRFLIPSGYADRFAAQIGKLPSHSDGHRMIHGCDGQPGFARFTMKELVPGRQQLKVEAYCNEDYENTSFYVATADGFSELRHRYDFGPGLAMYTATEAIIITAIVWGLVQLLTRRKRTALAAAKA